MKKSTTLKLWYFHGDQMPDGQYYCKRCDAFVDRNHFVAGTEDAGLGHAEDNNRYESDMRRYNAMKKHGVPEGSYRPKDADRYNLVERQDKE